MTRQIPLARSDPDTSTGHSTAQMRQSWTGHEAAKEMQIGNRRNNRCSFNAIAVSGKVLESLP
jgi:hypothetical protein